MNKVIALIKEWINKRSTGTITIQFYYGAIKKVDISKPVDLKQDELAMIGQ